MRQQCLQYLSLVVGAVVLNNSTKNGLLNPLLFLSTNQGLMAHYGQIVDLLKVAIAYKRLLIIAPFYSRHYHGHPVNFCDVFNISNQILCFQQPTDKLSWNSSSLLDACECSIHHTVKKGTHNTCEPSWLSNPASYGFPNYTFPCVPDFSYKSGMCTAGYLRQTHLNQKSPPVVFTSKYLQLGDQAYKDVLQNHTHIGEYPIAGETKLIVAHWRREDQLQMRCRQMPSPYCKGVEAFVSETKRKLGELINRTLTGKDNFLEFLNRNSSTRYVVYVATNEKDPELLKGLQRAGFIIYSDLQVSKLHLRHEDPFVIEVVLACRYALSVFSSGYSNFNPFIEQCRARKHGHYRLY